MQEVVVHKEAPLWSVLGARPQALAVQFLCNLVTARLRPAGTSRSPLLTAILLARVLFLQPLAHLVATFRAVFRLRRAQLEAGKAAEFFSTLDLVPKDPGRCVSLRPTPVATLRLLVAAAQALEATSLCKQVAPLVVMSMYTAGLARSGLVARSCCPRRSQLMTVAVCV